MVTTVTTTTTTTVTTISAASLALIAIILLLVLLVQKEIISSLEHGAQGSRLKQLGRALNIAIVPLGLAFAATCIASVLDVLK
jgi:hypothetical protein